MRRNGSRQYFAAFATHIVLSLAVLVSAWSAGCTPAARIDLAGRTGGSAALFGQIEAFDGHTGQRMSFPEVVRRCAAADVVLFGEEHRDAVCNAYQAQLLHALLERQRPTTLAMEFFETDMQPAVDAYLAGRIDESAFVAQTRQGSSYALSHRPLIEMCRAGRIPVLAANAPRRLLRQYRESKLPFDEFRAGLSADDQRWLPRTSEHLDGPYFERFIEIIKHHPPVTTAAATAPAESPATRPADAPEPMTEGHASGEDRAPPRPPVDPRVASFRPQLLWDDCMAEFVADYRAVYPAHRVMLIVGRFHVAHEGGTFLKFRQRRPRDRVCTIVYAGRPDAAYQVDEEDRDAADIVLSGLRPPEPRTTAPSTAPAPSASAPASQPASP